MTGTRHMTPLQTTGALCGYRKICRELTAVQPTGDRVYIVENEMVFSYLLKHLEQKECDVTMYFRTAAERCSETDSFAE